MNCRFPRLADDGSATVWMLALAAIAGLATLSVHVDLAAALARHRAGAAADLAALAGAEMAANVMADEGQVCEAAQEIARANGGRMRSCAVAARVIDVTVAVPLQGLFSSLVPPASARARAGPPAGP